MDSAAAVLLERHRTEALTSELAKAADLGALLQVMAERIATNACARSVPLLKARDDSRRGRDCREGPPEAVGDRGIRLQRRPLAGSFAFDGFLWTFVGIPLPGFS
jgi:hypothetical protein